MCWYLGNTILYLFASITYNDRCGLLKIFSHNNSKLHILVIGHVLPTISTNCCFSWMVSDISYFHSVFFSNNLFLRQFSCFDYIRSIYQITISLRRIRIETLLGIPVASYKYWRINNNMIWPRGRNKPTNKIYLYVYTVHMVYE